jgi:hypothetical protein
LKFIMAEGATLPWKMQRLNLAPSLGYDSIHKPLKPPKGKRWHFNRVLNEWSLVPAAGDGLPIADAVAVVDGNGGATAGDHYHEISPSDTFQGICLRYKVTPLALRRANGGFTGDNLSLVPNPLKIPVKDGAMTNTPPVVAEPLTQGQVVDILLKECRGTSISRSEARAYLMLNDWDLTEALTNAHEDGF